MRTNAYPSARDLRQPLASLTGPRLRKLRYCVPGIFLLAFGLTPVFSSDSFPRSALSFSCLLAGMAFLFADFKLNAELSGCRVLTPKYWAEKPLNWQFIVFIASVWFLVATFSMISVSTLAKFYSARLAHRSLLENGVVTQAEILRRCGTPSHGCVSIDYRDQDAKRYQKSLPIDRKFYDRLTEGDSITVVYPKKTANAAVFTEFSFESWKPAVPRAWAYLLTLILTIAWFPLKAYLKLYLRPDSSPRRI